MSGIDKNAVIAASGREIYLFPLAFLMNASSMTLLLIGVGTMGRAEVAADIAIVQGATLALFFAFSANARSIILGESSRISWQLILRSRVFLMMPLGGMALVVSLYMTDAAAVIALALVLRRCSEWISEIYLARMEREKHFEAALWFIVVQSILLVIAIISAIADFRFASTGLFLWALVPLLLTGGFLLEHFRLGSLRDSGWKHMLPHFGSTAITGITVFVFRLVILLLTGKAYAGNLFTAFAIGGILGSVFAQAFGPTLVFHAREGSVREIPGWLKACLAASVIVGIALVLGSLADWKVLLETGKPAFFWTATGASLIGGAIMVLAQRFRIRLLQHHEDGYVFGPDVLTNIFIVAFVPYVYYLLGPQALNWLFFINAVIGVIFYVSADRTTSASNEVLGLDSPALRQIIAAALLLPVFFQLKGQIFREKVQVLDSGGDLLSLPIPVSVLVCYGAIVVLGSYSRARASLSVIFVSFVLMISSVVLSTQGEFAMQQAKIILLIQFILPMLALVLGQTYVGFPGAVGNIAKAWFYVAVVIVPLQLAATWAQSLPLLSPYLYVFSIYQHLQYVPTMFVCAFVIACFTLWRNDIYRYILLALAIPYGAYVVLSLSKLTSGGLLIGIVVFIVYSVFRQPPGLRRSPFLMLLFISIGIYGGISMVERNLHKVGKEQTYFEMQAAARAGDDYADRAARARAAKDLSTGDLSGRNVPANDPPPQGVPAKDVPAKEGAVDVPADTKHDVAADGAPPIGLLPGRLQTWRFYVHEILDDGTDLALGHRSPPDRNQYRSAHNYYLDFIYNFGLISIFPMLWLIALTVWKVGRYWREILASPELFALAGAVLALLFIDNSLKVGLRQPYPAIITFFLWGVLLSRLRELVEKSSVQKFDGVTDVTRDAHVD